MPFPMGISYYIGRLVHIKNKVPKLCGLHSNMKGYYKDKDYNEVSTGVRRN